MFTKDDQLFHMVALILACSSYFGSSVTSAYKVRDNSEDDTEDTSDYSKYFENPEFIFPDYFGRSEEKSYPFSDEFGSDFQPYAESNNNSRYVNPSETFHALYGDEVSSRSQNPQYEPNEEVNEQRSAKKPIYSLYDDWTPEDEAERSPNYNNPSTTYSGGPNGRPPPPPSPLPPRQNKGYPHKPPPKLKPNTSQYYPLNFKPRQSPPKYNQFNQYKNSYAQPNLKPHYKTIHPSHTTPFNPSFRSPGPQRPKEGSVHQYQFGINHKYNPNKNNGEGNDSPVYNTPNSNNNPKQLYHKTSNPHINQPKNTFFDIGSWKSFKPSPPDVFRDHLTRLENNDFSTDYTTLVPKKAKANGSKKKHKSCIKTTKKAAVPKTYPIKLMSCYICVDDKTGRHYEQCSEEPEPDTKLVPPNSKKSERGKRDVKNVEQREKRDYDYSDTPEENHYGPDHKDYRFGPEHFVDDSLPVDHDSSRELPQESETCWKTRKGDMLCIVCENPGTGGTYEQCSYGSDPKKNSYERSVSKVYGTPRLPSDHRKYSSIPHGRPQSKVSQPQRYDRRRPIQRTSYGSQVHSSRPTSFPPIPRKPYTPYYKEQERSATPYKQGGNPNSRGGHRPSPSYPRQESRIPNYGPYKVPDPYNPDEGASSTQREQESYKPKNVARKNSYDDIPYEHSYDDTFPHIFPELSGVPVESPFPEYVGEYDEYDDGDYTEGGESVDGQGQFTVNKDKKVNGPSSEYYGNEEKKNEMERAIGDFSNKNRTACVKVKRNRMTCFQCEDEKGSKHEECMFIAGTEPKTKHLSYREVKEFNYEPANNTRSPFYGNIENLHERNDSSRFPSRGKRKYKKYHPEQDGKSYDEKRVTQTNRQPRSPLKTEKYKSDVGGNTNKEEEEEEDEEDDDEEEESEEENDKDEDEEDSDSGEPERKTEKTIKKQKKHSKKRKSDRQKDLKSEANSLQQRPNYNPIPTEPPDVTEHMGPEGAFSEDTVMTFDPVLGFSLPKYMLEKSEHEAIFDEALASG